MYPSLVSMLALAACAHAATILIEVGNGGLIFTPNETTANVGDQLDFRFFGDHSVVSATFTSPCVPGPNAFFSGDQASATSAGDINFIVDVTSTDPIWYYCSVGKHCQAGMVGVVNAPVSQTLQNFAEAAQNVSAASAPSSPAGGSLVTSSAPAVTTSTSSTTAKTGSATITNPGGPAQSVSNSTITSVRTSAISTLSSASKSPSAATSAGGAERVTEQASGFGLSVLMGGLAAILMA